MEYNTYYVYALVDPLNNEPFYVGKGKDNRAWDHLRVNEKTNEAKIGRIESIRRSGSEPTVVMLSTGLLEKVALRVESFYINKMPHLTNIATPKYDAFIYSKSKTEYPVRCEDAIVCYE